MKRVVLVVLVVTGSLVALSQTPDSIANKLIAIDETAFIGKPLDSVISVLTPGYIETKVVGLRGTARKLVFLYPNRVWIELHVREFVFINPYSRSQSWDIALFRKEKLYRTVIYKKQDCFRNCDVK